MRARLHNLIAELREAPTMPWDRPVLRLYREVFPDMAKMLPAEEGARLQAEFDAELARLEAA